MNPNTQPPKNIVVCCDGTGNQLNETSSNVVKLFMCLDRAPGQTVYYDPGVGTMSDANIVTPWSKFFSKLGGLAFGWGLRQNVTEAYAYLMDNYTPNDRIFLFGFSRGAYTVRALAAMIHAVGLLERGSTQLIPYAWKTFESCVKPKVYPVAQQFKETYSRKVDIHFVGVWDTVTSIGIFNRRKLPYSTNNPSIRNVRHAVAIDEIRTFYRQNLFKADASKDMKQVWFAGAHSDVGGSYALNRSGLSQIALEWMLRESMQFGLKVSNDKVKEIVYTGKGSSKPDCREEVHTSLKSFWWILELMPRIRRRSPYVFVPLGRRRRMFADYNGDPLVPVVHQSVLDKMKHGGYSPSNFTAGAKYNTEDWIPLIVFPDNQRNVAPDGKEAAHAVSATGSNTP